MKIVGEFPQNSTEWHAWRKRGLGASDAAPVMGNSPWTSRFELWAQKVGLLMKPEIGGRQREAMDRGTKLEPNARAWYENKMGILVPPVNAEHDDYPFIRASYDGINFDILKFIEIKTPGKEAHRKALRGQVPDYYVPQIQQQYLVAGPNYSCDYISYSGSDDGENVILPVAPDEGYQRALLGELIAFWDLVQNKIPPNVGPEEFVKLLAVVIKSVEKLGREFEALNLLARSFEASKGDALGSWAAKRSLKGE